MKSTKQEVFDNFDNRQHVGIIDNKFEKEEEKEPGGTEQATIEKGFGRERESLAIVK